MQMPSVDAVWLQRRLSGGTGGTVGGDLVVGKGLIGRRLCNRFGYRAFL